MLVGPQCSVYSQNTTVRPIWPIHSVHHFPGSALSTVQVLHFQTPLHHHDIIYTRRPRPTEFNNCYRMNEEQHVSIDWCAPGVYCIVLSIIDSITSFYTVSITWLHLGDWFDVDIYELEVRGRARREAAWRRKYRVESQFRYSKFLSQQSPLANDSENYIH